MWPFYPSQEYLTYSVKEERTPGVQHQARTKVVLELWLFPYQHCGLGF